MQIIKNRIKFFGFLVFLYTVLFEFVVPATKYFPKPTIIFDSFSDLFYDYNLVPFLILTTLVVLFAMLFSYLIIILFRRIIISFLHHYTDNGKILFPFKYIPMIAIPIIFLFWFGVNILSEFILVWVFAISYLLSKINTYQRQMNQAYIDSAQSLGVSQKKIYEEIYWKNIEPKLLDTFKNLNLILWSSALLIEYISGNFGVGSLYFQGFMYKDISAVFALTIIVSVLIAIIDKVVEIIKNYLIYWKSEL